MKEAVSCYRCDWYKEGDAGNVCRVSGWGTFDVDEARRIIKRHRRRAVRYSYRRLNRVVNPHSTIHEPHLAHVNLRKAIIVARYKVDGEPVERFLLEGRHRATRALLERLTLKVYELSLEETRAIFIGKRAPKGKRFVSKAA